MRGDFHSSGSLNPLRVSIILGAGTVSEALAEIIQSESPFRVPFGSRTVGHELIEREHKISNLTVVVADNQSWVSHLEGSQFPGMTFVEATNSEGILESLLRGVNSVDASNFTLRVVFADGLANDYLQDSVLIGDLDATHDWTFVNRSLEGMVLVESIARENTLGTFRGVVSFANGGLVRSLAQQLVSGQGDERSLGALVSRYQKTLGQPLAAVGDGAYIDMGGARQFFSQRIRTLEGRAHNEFHSESGWIWKTSSDGAKLQRERDWFINLPSPLRVFIPRISIQPRGITQNLETQGYGIQFFEALPFSDLLMWSSSPDDAVRIFTRGIEEWMRQSNLHPQLGPDKAMITHFSARWKQVSPELSRLIRLDQNELKLIESTIEKVQDFLSEDTHLTVLHGDLVFSNVMIRMPQGVLKLIDPRGGFDGPSVYGNPIYDWAKIAQCTFGRYDSLLAGQFSFDKDSVVHYYDVPRESAYSQLQDWFMGTCPHPQLAVKLGGLLLTLATPFHAESRDRQIAMVRMGIQLLGLES